MMPSLLSSIADLLLASSLLGAVSERDSLIELARASLAMSPTDAREVEATLRREPADVQSRARALAYRLAQGQEDERVEQALWFVTNLPADPIAASLYCLVRRDTDAYRTMRAAWNRQVEDHFFHPAVLWNAATVFGHLGEQGRTLELLEHGRKLQPEEHKWVGALLSIYRSHASSDEIGAEEAARVRRRALVLANETLSAFPPGDRARALVHTAVIAFHVGELDRARSYAQEALRLMTRELCDQPVNSHVIHDGHTVLGHIALMEEEHDRAREHLLLSCQSETLCGKTPVKSMSLARAFLLRGERDLVLTYLDLCLSNRFRRELVGWRRSIQEGRIPGFGPRGEL